MSARFMPDANASNAYIPVRVVDEAQPDGSTLVYLPDGTAFDVNDRNVVRVDRHGRSELSPDDQQVVQALIDERFPFDCDVIPVNANTWAIHGPIPVDGDVILAEFGTKEDAEVALELLSAAEAKTILAKHE